MKEYRIIDGVLCAVEAVNADEAKAEVTAIIKEIRPLLDGIATCEAQIARYRAEIGEIAASVDKELVRAVAPEQAKALGF